VIYQSAIDHWRNFAPWSGDHQVEQDLILSRAVVEIFSDIALGGQLAMRGGTALNKFHFSGGSRYSEDIDLVQITASPGGPLLDSIRKVLDPWLGKAQSDSSSHSMRLVYRLQSEAGTPMRLKVEINTREHFSVLGFVENAYAIENSWFSGAASVNTYSINELLGTKLRALYQRRKGRDLFDLYHALQQCEDCEPERIVECFTSYMKHGGITIRRSEYEANLLEKEKDKVFRHDMSPLLRQGIDYDVSTAFSVVRERIVALLPG
jgi:predicted nucleotidyltransferase component of viral defense system